MYSIVQFHTLKDLFSCSQTSISQGNVSPAISITSLIHIACHNRDIVLKKIYIFSLSINSNVQKIPHYFIIRLYEDKLKKNNSLISLFNNKCMISLSTQKCETKTFKKCGKHLSEAIYDIFLQFKYAAYILNS